MDKKEFDKEVAKERKAEHSIRKDVMDSGNYSSKSFDVSTDFDSPKTDGERCEEYKRLKGYKVGTEDKFNLAVYTKDDQKEELVLILDPGTIFEKVINKRLPKLASAAEKRELIDFWCVQFNAQMVENNAGQLDTRGQDSKAFWSKPHITER